MVRHIKRASAWLMAEWAARATLQGFLGTMGGAAAGGMLYLLHLAWIHLSAP
jgi:hypothetical protein